MTSGWKRQCGFSLLEIAIMLIVLGLVIFATLSYPSVSINLDAQAKSLASDIRYVQLLSMTKNERYRINFTSTQYSITELDGTTSVPHPVTGNAVEPLGTGITLSLNQGDSYLVFDGKGVPYLDDATPGATLDTNLVITLTREGKTQTVTVSPETGKVGVQ